MPLTTPEKEDLMLKAGGIAGRAATLPALLAANSIVRAGTTALSLKAELDAFLEALGAEASD